MMAREVIQTTINICLPGYTFSYPLVWRSQPPIRACAGSRNIQIHHLEQHRIIHSYILHIKGCSVSLMLLLVTMLIIVHIATGVNLGVMRGQSKCSDGSLKLCGHSPQKRCLYYNTMIILISRATQNIEGGGVVGAIPQ